MIDHPARVQVAEIVVDLADGNHAGGSAYLVAPGWVLTAGHVVHAATSIGVWLGAPSELQEADGIGVDPRRVLRAAGADLALLPIDGEGSRAVVDPALFGRLDRDSTEPVQVVAAGFPRFKLRSVPGRQGVLLRDLHFATGTIVGGSDIKTGTYEFAVHAVPDEDPTSEEHSPWEGMSGAAVWAAGRLIGVIGQHYPRENRGTLTVRPIQALFAGGDATQLAAWHNALTHLSARVEDLWVVTSPTARDLTIRRANQAAMRLAPEVLIARDSELDALAEFARSRQQWTWVRGDPFAGKTALLAWFALHPPEAVDIAACFLQSTSGENTLDYVLDMLTRQLAVFARVNINSPPRYPSERVSHFFELLEVAARACSERNRRLLLLVDGLDEYQMSGLDLAAWFPDATTFPQEASLLVSSREAVGVDLPATNPMHQHSYFLSPSDAATEIRAMARRELTVAVGDPGLSYPLLGCLAAADGGLTGPELGTLVRRSGRNTFVAEINTHIRTRLRRILMRISDGDGDAEVVHVFAHDTLMREACVLFEGDLPIFRDAVYGWADDYAQSGWPVTTPRYLLAPYAKMLKDVGDPTRLAALATDRGRHERMLERTLGDAAALVEIADAQELHLAQLRPDLTILTLLAIERDRLIHRNQALPVQRATALADVACVLAVIGRLEEAKQVAASIVEPLQRARAFSCLAGALAEVGDLKQAEGTVNNAKRDAVSVVDPRQHAAALSHLTGALATIGETQEAERVADSISEPAQRARAFSRLAGRAVGLPADIAVRAIHQAERAASSITEPGQQAAVLADLADALAAAGYLEQAVRVAARIPEMTQRARVLTRLAAALDASGRREQALRTAREAQMAATSVSNPRQEAAVLADLADALAAAGCLEQAVRAGANIAEPALQAEVLARLANVLVAAGQLEQAERAAARITDSAQRARVLAHMVGALTAGGHLEQAVKAAVHITQPGRRALALAEVASVFAGANQAEQAERVAQDAQAAAADIAHPGQRARVLAHIATTLTGANETKQADRAVRVAEQNADDITDPEERRYAFMRLAAELDAVGLLDQGDRAQAFGHLAVGLASFGQVEQAKQKADDAQRTANSITDPGQRAGVLAELAGMFTAAKQLDWAERAAIDIPDFVLRAAALTDLMGALAAAEKTDVADRVANVVQNMAIGNTDPDQQASALLRLAERYARSDSHESRLKAYRLCGLVLAGPSWRRALFLIGQLDARCLVAAVDVLVKEN